MSAGLNPALAFAAGALTILSPCVLPLVPVVIGSAGQRSKWGPLALSAGLVASFTAVGLAVAALGEASGFDGEIVRQFGAILLLLVGLWLVIPQAQVLMQRINAPLAGWASERQTVLDRFGLLGQTGIGGLLGIVWSPCIGPTLGAATVLAAQGQNLGEAAVVMAGFGLGVASMLLIIAIGARSFLKRWRGQLMSAGSGGKRVLGLLLGIVGVLILTGGDRLFEGMVANITPDWLNDITTSI